MKTKIFSVLGVAAMFYMTACEPTEYRYDMADYSYDTTTVLDLTAVGTNEGSNEVTLKMNNTGVYGYWEHGSAKSYTDRVTQIEGATGTYTYTFHILNSYVDADTVIRGFSQSIDYTVTQIDVSPGEQYEWICGEGMTGKTWVFDTEGTMQGSDSNGPKYWFKSGPGNYANCWWNSYTFCDDVNGEMTFDFNNGPTLSYKMTSSSTAVVGTFAFNADYTTFTTSGVTVLSPYSGDGDGPYYTFDVSEFAEDRLILHITALYDGSTDGWTWVFIPKE